MADLLVTEIPEADDVSAMINATSNGLHELPYINASTVISEFTSRTANGMQYTTLPNHITDFEKQKLTAKGFSVTENTVPSNQRDGAGDLYIGFQVALNETAAQKAMQITPNEVAE